MSELRERSLAERAWRVYELDEADAGDLTPGEFAAVFALAVIWIAWLATLLTLLTVGAHALIAWIAGA